jgi:hypothetical protein
VAVSVVLSHALSQNWEIQVFYLYPVLRKFCNQKSFPRNESCVIFALNISTIRDFW